MGCVSSDKYVVFFNGTPTNFFKIHRGLQQGFPLSPLLFLLVVESLSRILKKGVYRWEIQGYPG